ncbi:MAG: ATP-binding cassette domain-containing protein, partial [Lachnospiraceae bacterium]|nr:ATP-binding cassette domain-containing protein [Lachnospiraceae bacterium]
LETMTAGRYRLEGIDVGTFSREQRSTLRRRKIGFVFQKYQLLPEYTVWDNICMPLYLDHAAPDRAYLADILERFGIADRRDAYPDQLSGGQQQRVAIARALAHKPSLLLADEPTGNLDYRTGQDVMEMLALSREIAGQTIVLVTHDNESASYADRVLQLEDGRIRGNYIEEATDGGRGVQVNYKEDLSEDAGRGEGTQ